jgi:NAD(P)-dependent dehydrogenase (short-subunit alcohol dehydrogenase family)
MSRTIVITGASDGIGAACARQVSGHGHEVVVVGRSQGKTAAVAKAVGARHHVVDYTDLAQVRELAEELLSTCPRIDVLANNAGGIYADETTRDGFDTTFQVNHLAPFLLTHLLTDRLVESRASVVQTSSIGAKRFGNLHLDDLQNTRGWKATKAYGDAKLANILFTKELHRRFHAQGLAAVAFHPGNVATNFANDTSSRLRFLYRTPLRRLVLVGPEEGGQALTWLVEGAPGETWVSGEYYERYSIATTHPQAGDAALARGLWDRSEQLLGLTTSV